MKKKFNLKLTAFLVSLFVGLLLLILGNKNKYCLFFGFIILSGALIMFIYYTNDLITKNIQELEEEIENIDGKTEDDGFLLQDLYMAKNKLMKKKKSVRVTFGFCACLLVLVAILGIF